MALKPINPVLATDEGSGGLGGMIGNIAGSVLGGVAGAIGGGPMGAMAGAGAGGSIGGMAGGFADQPGSQMNVGGPALMTAAEQFPEVQMAQLMDSKKALAGSTQFSGPQKEAIGSIYDQAHQNLLKSLNQGGIG